MCCFRKAAQRAFGAPHRISHSLFSFVCFVIALGRWYIYIFIRYLQPGVLSQEPSTCRNCRVGYNEILVFSIIYIYIFIYLYIYPWGGVASRAKMHNVFIGRDRFWNSNIFVYVLGGYPETDKFSKKCPGVLDFVQDWMLGPFCLDIGSTGCVCIKGNGPCVHACMVTSIHTPISYIQFQLASSVSHIHVSLSCMRTLIICLHVKSQAF